MVQLSDLHAILHKMPRLDRHGIQPHGFDLDQITDADFPAFELAVDFLSPFWSGALAQLSQPLPSVSLYGGLNASMLTTRADRFAALCGLSISIPAGVMIAALVHSNVPMSLGSGAALKTPIAPPVIKAALDGHRDAIAIMTKSPEPLDNEEAKVLTVLALHGIDAPDGQIKRVFIAPRPDQIACIYSPSGSRWLHFSRLLPIGRAKKLGLEYLLEPTG